ncbi:MAG: tetratricopeptide repeat protein [Alphaproteobacteria bacterium]|nr:tetratricopeptide repeat protein [Alphaproteobacteria bacterium]
MRNVWSRGLPVFAALLCAAVVMAPIARAAGGGGGGSMGPSAPMGAPVDPAKSYREGIAALEAQDYRKAASRFRDVLSVAPAEPSVNYLLGLALIGSGDEKAAIKPLEKSVKSPDAPPDAFKQLGLAYLRTNHADKAQALLPQLEQRLAACGATCNEKTRAALTAARDGLTQALAGAPAVAPSMWIPPGEADGRGAYAQAVALIQHERWTDALAQLSVAQTAIGPHPDILNYLGFVSRKLGRYDVAERYYATALAIDPNHLGATEYLGELYLQMGRTAEAHRQLARLDRLCPYGCAQREELARWIVAAN